MEMTLRWYGSKFDKKSQKQKRNIVTHCKGAVKKVNSITYTKKSLKPHGLSDFFFRGFFYIPLFHYNILIKLQTHSAWVKSSTVTFGS